MVSSLSFFSRTIIYLGLWIFIDIQNYQQAASLAVGGGEKKAALNQEQPLLVSGLITMKLLHLRSNGSGLV